MDTAEKIGVLGQDSGIAGQILRPVQIGCRPRRFLNRKVLSLKISPHHRSGIGVNRSSQENLAAASLAIVIRRLRPLLRRRRTWTNWQSAGRQAADEALEFKYGSAMYPG